MFAPVSWEIKKYIKSMVSRFMDLEECEHWFYVDLKLDCKKKKKKLDCIKMPFQILLSSGRASGWFMDRGEMKKSDLFQIKCVKQKV